MLQENPLAEFDDRSRPVAYTKLFVDVSNMDLHSRRRNIEPRGDLLVRKAFDNQIGNLTLSRSQRVDRRINRESRCLCKLYVAQLMEQSAKRGLIHSGSRQLWQERWHDAIDRSERIDIACRLNEAPEFAEAFSSVMGARLGA